MERLIISSVTFNSHHWQLVCVSTEQKCQISSETHGKRYGGVTHGRDCVARDAKSKGFFFVCLKFEHLTMSCYAK